MIGYGCLRRHVAGPNWGSILGMFQCVDIHLLGYWRYFRWRSPIYAWWEIALHLGIWDADRDWHPCQEVAMCVGLSAEQTNFLLVGMPGKSRPAQGAKHTSAWCSAEECMKSCSIPWVSCWPFWLKLLALIVSSALTVLYHWVSVWHCLGRKSETNGAAPSMGIPHRPRYMINNVCV